MIKMVENSLEHKAILELIKSWGVDFSGKSLIDIGCGTGNYTLYLAKECKQILGIDSSKGMLDRLERSVKFKTNKC